MYNPPQYMTTEVVTEVLAEFAWPAPFTIEEWLPDGIEVSFPGCTLFFVEGFESEMDLAVSSRAAGIDEPVDFAEVLHALRATGLVPEDDDVQLINEFSPNASLEKVRNRLRNLCTMVLAYLADALRGDTSWAVAYRSVHAQVRPGP